MPGKNIRRPSGSTPAAEFCKAVYENVASESKIGFVDGVEMGSTTLGKFVIPKGGGRSRKGVTVKTFKLRFAEDDFLVCREWDGTTIGSDDFYVAKPDGLICSRASFQGWGTGPAFTTYTCAYALDTSEPYMEYGTTVSGSSPAVNEWGEEETSFDSGELHYQLRLNSVRTVTADGILENQRVIPVWLKGDIIYGLELDTPLTTTTGLITDEGLSIDYVMIGDGRQWARI